MPLGTGEAPLNAFELSTSRTRSNRLVIKSLPDFTGRLTGARRDREWRGF